MDALDNVDNSGRPLRVLVRVNDRLGQGNDDDDGRKPRKICHDMWAHSHTGEIQSQPT